MGRRVKEGLDQVKKKKDEGGRDGERRRVGGREGEKTVECPAAGDRWVLERPR